MDEELKLFLLNFIVSGFAAAMSKTIVSSLERAKLILQNQELSEKIMNGHLQKYKGIMDCLRRLRKEEGILNYWRGNGTNLLRYVPLQSMNFSFFSYYHNTLSKHFQSKTMSVTNSFLAGALAGLTSISVVFPLDLCLTKLAMDFGIDPKLAKERELPAREFTGLRDCLIRVVKTNGFFGIYRGFSSSAIGWTLHRCLYFGVFEILKDQKVGNQNFRDANFLVKYSAAQLITMVASFVTYPFDTTTRRMIIDSSKPKELRKLGNLRQSIRTTFINEGIRGFYKGVLANILKSSGGALVMVFYDEIINHTPLKQIVLGIRKEK